MPTQFHIQGEGRRKWCTHCAIQKPLADFAADEASDDGYKSVCRECRVKLDEKAKPPREDPRIREVEEDLARAVASMPTGGTCSPHYAEIGEALMRRCGGVEGFARLYMAHIYCTKPGSTERGKALRDMLSLHVKLSESGGERLETMNGADLTRIMSKAIRDYQEKLDLPANALPTIDVTPKKVGVSNE